MRIGEGRWTRFVAAAVGLTVLVSSAISFPSASGPDSVSGMQSLGNGERVAPATPIAGSSAQADPLDGHPPAQSPPVPDPLDGRADKEDRLAKDPDAPDDEVKFSILRSGRPKEAARSDVVYDGDIESEWAVEAGREESWLWVDVGSVRRLKTVRWMVTGEGEFEIAISADRERWESFGSVKVESGWGGIALREDARYVRLTVRAGEGDEPPAIAEVAVYGRELNDGATLAQKAKDESRERNERDRSKKERRAERAARAQEADDAGSPVAEEEPEGENADGIRVSTKKGETRCKGDRARCRAREGKVSVEEDCSTSGSCTIDVRADGGSAVCDSSGGRKNRAGDGEGKRVGSGGRCEAVADGGTVTIGDINP